MGKKSWFSAVRKVISTSYLKEKKHKKSHNKSKSTKKPLHGNQMSLDTSLTPTKAPLASPPIQHPTINEPEFKQPAQKPMEQEPTAIAIKQESTTPCFLCKSRQDIAATKIQKAYRGYLVRNNSNPLKAWRRLKMYMQTQSVKRQGESTLMTMQSMTRVQSQVRSRKIKMAEVNEALQKQLHQKRLNKVNTKKSSEKGGWNSSPKSKEQVEADLRRRKEGAQKNEKMLAYSYSRQQTWRKNLQKSATSKSADWEWNWSAKWDVVRPWETGTYRDSVRTMNKQVSRQAPPSKVAAVAAQPTKSVNTTWSPMSNSGKKRAPSTGAGAGSAKKRVVVSGSPRSPGSSKMNTNTKRWV